MCNHRSNSSDDGFVQLGKPDINLEKAVHLRISRNVTGDFAKA
jgi:hypothetical protein